MTAAGTVPNSRHVGRPRRHGWSVTPAGKPDMQPKFPPGHVLTCPKTHEPRSNPEEREAPCSPATPRIKESYAPVQSAPRVRWRCWSVTPPFETVNTRHARRLWGHRFQRVPPSALLCNPPQQKGLLPCSTRAWARRRCFSFWHATRRNQGRSVDCKALT